MEHAFLVLGLLLDIVGVVTLALDIYETLWNELDARGRIEFATRMATRPATWGGNDQPVSPPEPGAVVDLTWEPDAGWWARRRRATNGIGMIVLGFVLQIGSALWGWFPPT